MAVLVCGGAVVDCIVKPLDVAQVGASRTSLPGRALVSLGGVGRNIAEVIARLGGSAGLLSVIGMDGPGQQVLAGCRHAGVGVDTVAHSPTGRTATYTALLDGSGELVGAIADMDIFEEISPEAVRAAAAGLGATSLVLCDANLPAAVLEEALACAAAASAPAWFEPVSVAKALLGRRSRPWHLITPNGDELLALLGRPGSLSGAGAGGPSGDLTSALNEALEGGLAEHVLVTLGAQGAILASAEGSLGPRPAKLPSSCELDVSSLLRGIEQAPAGVPPLAIRIEAFPAPSGRHIRYRLLQPLSRIADVTGAGDALLAGTARAFTSGWPLEEAVLAGMLCAHLTLFVNGAVATFLTPDLFERLRPALWGKSRL